MSEDLGFKVMFNDEIKKYVVNHGEEKPFDLFSEVLHYMKTLPLKTIEPELEYENLAPIEMKILTGYRAQLLSVEEELNTTH